MSLGMGGVLVSDNHRAFSDGCQVAQLALLLGCYDVKFVSREDREDFKDVGQENRAKRALSTSVHPNALCAKSYADLLKIFATFA